jgi:predicted unusual protein kinase regulating ubiquinone biosynthesis (AarF/ABC1/UbiB family)
MGRGNAQVPRGRGRRLAPLAGLTARTVCGRVVARWREAAGADGAVARFDELSARRYAVLLGRSRGVLMKVGQIFAMCDTDNWGGGGFEPYFQALSQVQREVPAMNAALVDAMLHTELGDGIRCIAQWDSMPIATASIGQVHRAVLTDGRPIAVKIQYPGVAGAIEDDLSNAELLSTFLRLIASGTSARTDVGAIALAAAARIRDEVDYRREATTLKTFGELYRDHPFIRIPEVIDDACGARVLTMTYLDGIDWSEAQHADQELKNTWAEAIVRFVYGNRWLAGLLHADPHPSNYRFFPDGTVGFLDFGCVERLTDAERYDWYRMIRAAVEGRKADLRTVMAEMGFLDTDPELSGDELYDWWARLLGDIIVESQPVTYTLQNPTRVISNLFDFREPRHPVNRVSFSAAGVFTARIQLSLASICAALGATLPIRAISDDMDGVGEPVTILGRQHHAWIRARGLRLIPAQAN